MNNPLNIRKIKISKNQTFKTPDRVKFSLKKWLAKAFRDEYTGKFAFRDSELGELTFGVNKGLYTTYKPIELLNGDEFFMLELAITSLTREVILSKTKDFKHFKKIAIEFDKEFAYENAR